MKALSLFLISALLLSTSALAEIKGVYKKLPGKKLPKAASYNKVVIHEYFSFGCGHCFHLHEQLPALKAYFGDKLEVVGVPVALAGEEPGRLYYIALQNGKEEAVKDMIFQFIHVKKFGQMMYQRDKLQFVAKLNKLTSQYDTLKDDPAITAEVLAGRDYFLKYEFQGTPTVVIEGSIQASGDVENLKRIINSLLKRPVQ